ncbi:hypothetical protein A2U01_0112432, partial [Trifolium medium]|nr:hypothetical protein [Trifolium medium]
MFGGFLEPNHVYTAFGTLKNRVNSPSEPTSELRECLSLSVAVARDFQMFRRFISLKPGNI